MTITLVLSEEEKRPVVPNTSFCAERPASTPRRRLLELLVFTLCGLAVALLYSCDRMVYVPTDVEHLHEIEGWVSGYPDTWKLDGRPVVQFDVSYRLQDGVRHQEVFSYREGYEGAGLRIAKKVMLTVEVGAEHSMVREVATLDGKVLFDERLYWKVVNWHNRHSDFMIGFGVFLGLVGACLMLWSAWGDRHVLLQR
ncbi:hypothetical protein [Pseudomonas xantholysinigenes]|uniref:Uncharacterized protein n=1 Tax=Pseudomonas xantholysinigenes TaxID=2745490 RepID=A0A9E6PTH9_9PSED|nr:hypothetical protein [Pseudomonas xantholysinigenes]QXI37337.1 hypothetical protein HU772_018615 [Pseudomonas xantholysinigenes]